MQTMSVLMVGVDESTRGGMWTVVENYLQDERFVKDNGLVYIPTAVTGCSALKKICFTLAAFRRIQAAYREKHFDIVHVHMSERSSIARKGMVMRYAKRRGSKIVLHMHGAEFEALYLKMSTKDQAKVRGILNIADRVIILGEYWREFIGGLLDDPAKIRVVYNAVAVPEKCEYNEASRNVLFLGLISERKGINVLLSALKQKSNFIAKCCKVTIYGPDAEGNIEKKISENGLSEWVSYCGWLDSQSKPEVLKDTAINVLPSYFEGLPMTILEAMSYGVPSITTTVAAIPEAVNEKNGVLIPPGDAEALADALESLVADRGKRLEMSRNAYTDAKERFSTEQHISRIQAIYNELS